VYLRQVAMRCSNWRNMQTTGPQKFDNFYCREKANRSKCIFAMLRCSVYTKGTCKPLDNSVLLQCTEINRNKYIVTTSQHDVCTNVTCKPLDNSVLLQCTEINRNKYIVAKSRHDICTNVTCKPLDHRDGLTVNVGRAGQIGSHTVVFHVHLDSIADDGQIRRPGDPVYEANHAGSLPQTPAQDHQKHQNQQQRTNQRQTPHCSTWGPDTDFSFIYIVW
jgi:hypothetical protein